jgi:hypothetical protein
MGMQDYIKRISEDRAEPSTPRLDYFVVRLHGGIPSESGRAQTPQAANTLHAALVAAAGAGSEIHTYISAHRVTPDEARDAYARGDIEEGDALWAEWLAAR